MPKAWKALGLDPDDCTDPVDLWPENERVWHLFVQMSGQWRVGLCGRYALDYSALFLRMERLRLDDEAWEALFADVRVCEAAALQAMHTPDDD